MDGSPASGELRAFEVFLQTGSTTPLGHVGSLLAKSGPEAWRLARETYGRRDNAVRLWVVGREEVHSAASDSRRLLEGKSRMPYRLPAFPQERRRRRAGVHRDARPAPAPVSAPAMTAALPAEPAAHTGGLWPAVIDDLFLHAHRLAGRTVDYTELEEALAVGSIAQEDLAHARTLLGLIGYDDAAADAHFFDRPAQLWQPTALTASARDGRAWSVARGLIVSAGVTALVSCACDALDDTPVGHATRTALEAVADEQRLHLEHWATRAARYAGRARTGEPAAVLATAVQDAGDFFGTPALTVLTEAGTEPAADGTALPAIPADVLTERFHRLLHSAELPPSFLPGLPQQPSGRVTGEAFPDLADVLGELRTVRAQYPQGAFQ
ncbi:hypothetical protein [Streptomyces sp. NPDC053427]|uniref:hypothetical protein n=1 Tax=Streptomyces sp. NPDC053427 TaxID=3365701 RepID=UPI0037D69732